jgi:hypothetical protein
MYGSRNHALTISCEAPPQDENDRNSMPHPASIGIYLIHYEW